MTAFFQVFISLILVVLILLQERSAGLSSLFGGGESGGFYQTRRGLEKIVFSGTIVGAVIFAGIAILRLIVF